MGVIKTKYYNLNSILSYDAVYNVIYGERSNGKTYAVLYYGLEQYFKNGAKMAIIRRWQDDLRGKRGATTFDNLVANGVIEDLSYGEWTSIYYYSQRWFFCRYDDKGNRISADEPFCYGFALTSMEHDKSSSYPGVKTIFFDEFLTRGMYLDNEFVMFLNVISTIVREKNDAKIFMCGNTVNQYAPYFAEMGLTNVKNQKKGTIDIYRYGQSDLTVAVEYSDSPVKGKKSDVYFAFNNPKLEMITGGAWEIDIYPHLPEKYVPKDILFSFFIKFDNDILQADVVDGSAAPFIFIHRKTTPIQNDDVDLVYSTEYSSKPNYKRKINNTNDRLSSKIWKFFKDEKVFYQDNMTGEIIRNYLQWCS